MLEQRIPPPIHFTIADFLDERRHSALLARYDRCAFNSESESLVERPSYSGSVHQLPGAVVSQAQTTPARSKTLADPTKGDDDLAFAMVDCAGQFAVAHCGRHYELPKGAGALHSCDQPIDTTNYGPARAMCIKIPRQSLLPLLADGEAAINKVVAPSKHALWMLRRYVPIATDERTIESAHASKMAAEHLRDLVALALGPSADGIEEARRGGLKAARIHAIKMWIEANLGEPGLTLDHASALFGLSRRTIQALFEEEDETFTTFIRKRRLSRVHEWLSSADHDYLSVSEIAYSVGFGDLSYFNRSFRKRFGCTPGDIRKSSRNLKAARR